MEGGGSIEEVIKLCILAFPSLWYDPFIELLDKPGYDRLRRDLLSTDLYAVLLQRQILGQKD